MASKPIASFFQPPKRLRVAEPNSKEFQLNNPSEEEEEEELGNLTTQALKRPLIIGDPTRKLPQEQSTGELAGELSVHNKVEQKASEISKEQKMRMEINKASARAKRNLRACQDRVAEAQGKGVTYPHLVELLVDQSWVEVLQNELCKPYMEKLAQFVHQEAAAKIPIYPPAAKLFNAFNSCPFESVKVVILGQDPYHGPGQAMGLCFSVPHGIKVPSSLVNIYKEIHADIGCSIPSHGNLERWAFQGVLLLNTVLTVRDQHANSHAKKGWEPFTDAAIRAVSQQHTGIIFLLWGNSAQEKSRLIDAKAHHILKASHPSGLSAHKGFFGCRHFSQTNKLLEKAGHLPIDWQL
ncbi:hypothetical protein CY35_10G043800 [Sphagnum magellanicum]|nr:hypothetical protein CY35_10G043800 [Sphagnum magellanicum]